MTAGRKLHPVLENGAPDECGVIESTEFPGLRLNVGAALALDRAAVLDALAPTT